MENGGAGLVSTSIEESGLGGGGDGGGAGGEGGGAGGKGGVGGKGGRKGGGGGDGGGGGGGGGDGEGERGGGRLTKQFVPQTYDMHSSELHEPIPHSSHGMAEGS